MKRTHKALFIALVSALIGFGTLSTGRAQSNFEVISVPPTALKPADYQNNALPWVSGPDAFYFANNPSLPVDSTALVPLSNLPDQIRIMGLNVYYIDNACGIDQKMVVTLSRHDLATGQVLTMAEVTTDGAPCLPDRRTVEDSSVDAAVIDNTRYSYALTVRFYDGIDRLRFLGAQIAFQGFKLAFR